MCQNETRIREEEDQSSLEQQLHEQYAINNNTSITNFISFLTAIFALFGSFGYVFVHSTNTPSQNGLFINEGVMSYEVFLFCSIIVSGMLFFLSTISLYLGYSNRNNQIIIDRIRKKYYKDSEYNKIFGTHYNAEGKNFVSFIQDYFNIFYMLFIAGQITVLCATYCKLQAVGISCFTCCVIVLQFLFIILSIVLRYHYYSKYKKRLPQKKKESKWQICILNRCNCITILLSLFVVAVIVLVKNTIR